MLLKTIKPELFLTGLRAFIIEHIGDEFVKPPILNLEDAYGDSNNLTPLIFLLTPGNDPYDEVKKLADRNKRFFYSVSLGQGQGVHARKLILEAIENGG